MTSATEKQLDAALDDGFKNNPQFLDWFLSKTKFASRAAEYHWSRSNHPWGTVTHTTVDPVTGMTESKRRESETDVLLIVRTQDGERVALHIENKIGTGKFTSLQPQLYATRATEWLNKKKYENYTDFQTVLVAPEAFREKNRTQADIFDCFVSHEDVAWHLPVFEQIKSL